LSNSLIKKIHGGDGGGGASQFTGEGEVDKTPNDTPSTDNPSSRCDYLKIYLNGQEISPDQVEPGTIYVISVTGPAIDKARFSINGDNWIISTSEKDSDEFYINYTFEGENSFEIEGEIHAYGYWWAGQGDVCKVSFETDIEKSLYCQDLSRNPEVELEVGDSVSFSCSHLTTNVDFDHYNYRIHYPSLGDDGDGNPLWEEPSDWQNLSGSTPDYIVSEQGQYFVECQVCDLDGNCTNWGKSGGWSPT